MRRSRSGVLPLDRLPVLDPAGIRREGAALNRSVFDEVLAATRGFRDLA